MREEEKHKWKNEKDKKEGLNIFSITVIPAPIL